MSAVITLAPNPDVTNGGPFLSSYADLSDSKNRPYTAAQSEMVNAIAEIRFIITLLYMRAFGSKGMIAATKLSLCKMALASFSIQDANLG